MNGVMALKVYRDCPCTGEREEHRAGVVAVEVTPRHGTDLVNHSVKSWVCQNCGTKWQCPSHMTGVEQ